MYKTAHRFYGFNRTSTYSKRSNSNIENLPIHFGTLISLLNNETFQNQTLGQAHLIESMVEMLVTSVSEDSMTTEN